MTEKQDAQAPKRSGFARAISALMMIGVLLFIIPGTDNTVGLRPGTLSTVFLTLAFVTAVISFILSPGQKQ